MPIIDQSELSALARASVARLVSQPRQTARPIAVIEADIDAERARIRASHWTADFNKLAALIQELNGAKEREASNG